MLTNAYYYGLYKPYIIDRRRSADISRSVRQNSKESMRFYKNNAVKNDMVEYARDITRYVTEMKDSSRFLSQNADSYYLNVLNEDFGSAREWASEDLSSFAKAYNAAAAFSANQEHSKELKKYAGDIVDIAVEDAELLSEAGITLGSGGMEMAYDKSVMEGMDYLDFGKALSQAGQVAERMYERTSRLLQLPISRHMDFKQLSYYYNYRFAREPAGRTRYMPPLETGIVLNKFI